MKEGRIGYESVMFELMSIVTLYKEVKASSLLLKYADILKNNSMKMVHAQNTNDYRPVQDLKPYFDGIVYSIDRMNLKNC